MIDLADEIIDDYTTQDAYGLENDIVDVVADDFLGADPVDINE